MATLTVSGKADNYQGWSCKGEVQLVRQRATILRLWDFEHDEQPVDEGDVPADVLADLEYAIYEAFWAEWGENDGSDLEVAQEHLYSRERFA
jgi:hypothetical protein